MKITKINLSIKSQNIMGFIKGPNISDDEEGRHWQKNKWKAFIGIGFGVLVLMYFTFIAITRT